MILVTNQLVHFISWMFSISKCPVFFHVLRNFLVSLWGHRLKRLFCVCVNNYNFSLLTCNNLQIHYVGERDVICLQVSQRRLLVFSMKIKILHICVVLINCSIIGHIYISITFFWWRYRSLNKFTYFQWAINTFSLSNL